jgi:hypothetical protein
MIALLNPEEKEDILGLCSNAEQMPHHIQSLPSRSWKIPTRLGAFFDCDNEGYDF